MINNKDNITNNNNNNNNNNTYLILFIVFLIGFIVFLIGFIYFDANSLEIIKRESRIGANIYYIRYVLEPDYDYNTANPLYFVINRLIGYIEKIEGSSDKYLVVADSLRNKNTNSVIDMIWKSIESKIEDIINPYPGHYPNIKIKDYDKFKI